MYRSYRPALAVGLLSSALMLTLPAAAQQSPVGSGDQSASPATDQTGDTPGDILVTATRRAERLSDVPIAITAISGETLAATGAVDLRGIDQVAPSLLVSGATSEANFTARIRGIGTVGENPGLESSVGLFVDGVYRARSGVGLTELGEVDRVEVLRGPQGTLFGRNSTAGTISIVTRAPELGRADAHGSVSYGNYDYWRLDGAVNLPVGETAALRVDGVWQRRDGFIKQLTPGEPDIQDRNRWLARGQFAWAPSDALSVRIIGDYAERHENCCNGVLLGPVRNLTRTDPAGNAVAVGPNTLLPLLQALGANYQLPPADERFRFATSTSAGVPYRSEVRDWGVSGEVDWHLGGATLTSITAWRDYKNRMGQDNDFNRLDLLDRQDLDRRFRNFSQEVRLAGRAFDGRLDWLVGGYYGNEKLNVDDDQRYGQDYTRFANCIIATSFAASGLGHVDLASPTCSTAPTSVFAGYDAVARQLGAAPLNGTGANDGNFTQVSRNWALFTHNTVAIVPDRLFATIGVRYTDEHKQVRADYRATNTLCPALLNSSLQSLAGLACVVNGAGVDIPAGTPGSTFDDGQWTGTAVLGFKPVTSVLVYASASRGYKAGGFNLDFSGLDRPCFAGAGTAAQQAACATLLSRPANTSGNGRAEVADLAYASEKVTAYEVGAKWNGRSIDVNVAAFHQLFSGYQLNTYNGTSFEVANIQSCRDGLNRADTDASAATGACAPDRLRPGVVSTGVELESTIRPARDVSVNLGFTYAHTRYRRDLVGTGGRPLSPVLFQLPDHDLSNAPEVVTTAGIGWTPAVGTRGLTGLVYVDMRMQSDTNTGSDLDLEKVQDAFAVVNGRLGLYGANKRWGVELWAQNLLDQRYFQLASDIPAQGSGTFRSVQQAASGGFPGSANQLFIGFPGEPRTYGVTLRGSF
ncbi:TonB-dependent receptor [Sphingomonas sp. Mn802worker]|uniref:TonB-dependent receptor n=1 Tax=Sphingomonas sp. Mn802worker TaxID=629773 RepID=UPI00037D342B|nr:TonB-dependent receptor [Sphingomonas sp. Mn802worker]